MWPESQSARATEEPDSSTQNSPDLHPGLSRRPCPPRGAASLELLGDELLVVEVAQPLLLHQGALSLQRVLLPPRRLRHAHAQLRLRALQQRPHRLLVLQLRGARADAPVGPGGRGTGWSEAWGRWCQVGRKGYRRCGCSALVAGWWGAESGM